MIGLSTILFEVGQADGHHEGDMILGNFVCTSMFGMLRVPEVALWKKAWALGSPG